MVSFSLHPEMRIYTHFVAMEDPKDLGVPNANDEKKKEADSTLKIVLEPVDSSFDEAYPSTSGSASSRPKRIRLRKWPPRSPSPSPPPSKTIKIQEEQKDSSEQDDSAFQVEEVEGDAEEELSPEDLLEKVFYYGNDTDNEGTEEADGKKKTKQGSRTRSKAQSWQHVCSMPSEDMFQKWKFESERKIAPARWAKKRASETKAGQKRYYHCSVRDCKAELSITYPSRSETVEVFRNGRRHVHPMSAKKWGLSPEIKQEIMNLWESGVHKPRLIKAALNKKGLMDYSDCQLSNFLERMKKKRKSPEPTVSISALQNWCNEHSITHCTAALDVDQDRVYVFDHDLDFRTGQFRFVLSSKRLMKFPAQATMVNLDSSQTMKWFDASVMFVGVTDATGVFYPVMFAVMSAETRANYAELLRVLKRCVEASSSGSKFEPRCVLSNGDPQIEKAAEDVFPDAVRRVCWLQVKKETRALLKHVQKEVRGACEADLDSLRMACDQEQFELAAKLMLNKWRDLLPPDSDVPGKFHMRFVLRSPGWYEGFDVESHSSNRGLTQFVNALKGRHMLRERLPPERYLTLALELVLEWSVGVGECPELQTIVVPDKALLHDTYRLRNEEKTMVDVNSVIYVPAGDRNSVTVEEVNEFEEKMSGKVTSFDEFMEARMSLWKVVGSGSDTDVSDMRCTCPRFFSGKVCEHVLAIGSAFGVIALPEASWDSGQSVSEMKRKRGRPPKSKWLGHQ